MASQIVRFPLLSWWWRCELFLYISDLQFFLLIHEALSNNLMFIYTLNMNNPLDISKNYCCFKFGLVHLSIPLSWWTWSLTLYGFSLTFWVTLKKTIICKKLLDFLKVQIFKTFWEYQHQFSSVSFGTKVRILGISLSTLFLVKSFKQFIYPY